MHPTASSELPVLAVDVLRARPDLEDEQAWELAKYILENHPRDKLLTAHEIRQHGVRHFGGVYYAEASLRDRQGNSRPVLIQLWSGLLLEGTFEDWTQRMAIESWRRPATASEYARSWMAYATTLDIPALQRATLFRTYRDEVCTDIEQLRLLSGQLRLANQPIFLGPDVSQY